jgi:hypothetical protein
VNGGKGRLPDGISNKKRKYAPNQKDISSLPKTMFIISNVSEEQKTIEQIRNESINDQQLQPESQIKTEIADNDFTYGLETK